MPAPVTTTIFFAEPERMYCATPFKSNDSSARSIGALSTASVVVPSFCAASLVINASISGDSRPKPYPSDEDDSSSSSSSSLSPSSLSSSSRAATTRLFARAPAATSRPVSLPSSSPPTRDARAGRRARLFASRRRARAPPSCLSARLSRPRARQRAPTDRGRRSARGSRSRVATHPSDGRRHHLSRVRWTRGARSRRRPRARARGASSTIRGNGPIDRS